MSRRFLNYPSSNAGASGLPFDCVYTYTPTNPSPEYQQNISRVPADHVDGLQHQSLSPYQYPDPIPNQITAEGYYYPDTRRCTSATCSRANTAHTHTHAAIPPRFEPRGTQSVTSAHSPRQPAPPQQSAKRSPATQVPVLVGDLPSKTISNTRKHQTLPPPPSSEETDPLPETEDPDETEAAGNGVAVPTWKQYPQTNVRLPATLTLYQVANQWPNHLYDEYLDAFIRARWTAGEIQDSMPLRCQNDLNARSAQDKRMWIQKRIQAREGFLKAAPNNAWKTLWESPRSRADGRPANVNRSKSITVPKQHWLDKCGLRDVSPAGAVVRENGTDVWREPVGVSYFRLKGDWVAPAGRRARKRPFSTINVQGKSGGAVKARRRRTAPADGSYPDDVNDEETESKVDTPDQSIIDSWPKIRNGGHAASEDEEEPEEEEENDDGNGDDEDEPRQKRSKLMPKALRPKSGMRREPIDYKSLDIQ